MSTAAIWAWAFLFLAIAFAVWGTWWRIAADKAYARILKLAQENAELKRQRTVLRIDGQKTENFVSAIEIGRASEQSINAARAAAGRKPLS